MTPDEFDIDVRVPQGQADPDRVHHTDCDAAECLADKTGTCDGATCLGGNTCEGTCPGDGETCDGTCGGNTCDGTCAGNTCDGTCDEGTCPVGHCAPPQLTDEC